MKIKKKLVSALSLSIMIAIVFTLGLNVNKVGAAETNATDEINVTIRINEKSIVDISPATLNWTTPLDPGSTGSYKRIQIENMGSVNLTHVWFNNSYPDSDPFGTGLSKNYDAGNFMAISKDQDGQKYYFPNRVDYNATSDIIYLKGPNSNTPPNVPYGRFRNASKEYFWTVDCSVGDNCTEGNLRIGQSPHTQSQTGEWDLSDNGDTGLTSLGDWGYAAITVNGDQICVAMYHDGTKAMFYKYNMDAPGAESCGNADYFIDYSEDGAIYPGASGYARIRPLVPYGVVYNSTNPEISGSVTVLVNTIK